MTRLACFFIPAVNMALVIAVAVALVTAVVWHVSVVHELRASRQRECAAELRAVKARNPAMAHWITPADPCVALTVFGDMP